LSERGIKELTRPRGIMAAVINLGIDTSVGRSLRDLGAYQVKDPKLLKIMEAVKQKQTPPDGRYLVRDGVLYSKDSITTHTGDHCCQLNVWSFVYESPACNLD
jgi:hypothetical protein